MAVMETPLSLTIPEQDQEILRPWLKRKQDARDDRKNYEPQWRKNQAFAAGVQWLVENPNTGEVRVANKNPKTKRLLDTVDVLSQYSQTAIGKLAQGDLRPELLASYDDDQLADLYTEQLNDALAFAWDEECKADRKLLAVLRCLVELGTCAVRCRVDRTGPLIADNVPHLDGKPILDKAHQYQVMSDPAMYGRVDLRPLREAKIVWEKVSPWNLLPPPGIEDPADFPWHLIVRPVALTDLVATYGDKAALVRADKIEDLGGYGASNMGGGPRFGTPGLNQTTQPVVVGKLTDHALVYTGYKTPDQDFPNGQTVVFSHDGHLLDQQAGLPYTQKPWGPRPGLTYFRWHTLEGRFWGRAFMEPGMGPQLRRNKRASQIDEIIDRGMPRSWAEEGSFNASQMTGSPLEVIFVKPGSTLPKTDGGIPAGPWMQADVEACDTDIEKALGLRGPTLGNAPAGVSAYSAMALLTENDAVKLDPVAQEFKLGISDVSRDTIEAMRQWPPNKQLLIAGEGNSLKAQAFDAEKAIPPAFLVRPAKGGTLPRSQAAEVQKIADLWDAAVVAGVVAQDPVAWIEWYKASLDAGNALDLPGNDQQSQQLHKAALENIVMVRSGHALPVAPYDDATIHVQEHRQEQEQLAQAAALGDEHSATSVQVIEQHVQEHLQMAQQNAAVNAASAPAVPGAPGGGAGAAELPLPAYENTLQTPRLPRIGTNYGFR